MTQVIKHTSTSTHVGKFMLKQREKTLPEAHYIYILLQLITIETKKGKLQKTSSNYRITFKLYKIHEPCKHALSLKLM